MHSNALRLGAAGLFLGLSACGVFPVHTNFAALDVNTGEIYTGALNTMFGEPTGAVEMSGLLKHVTCEGVAGNGFSVSEGAPDPQTAQTAQTAQTKLIVRCDDGRFIRGTLHYKNRTTGFGRGRDTQGAPYRFLFGYSNGTETALRAGFAALESDPPATSVRDKAARINKDATPPRLARTALAETMAASLEIFPFEDDDEIDRAPE